MLDNLKRDTRRLREIKAKPFPFYVIESLLFENGYQAVVAYRLASWFKHRRIPLFGPLFARLGLFFTGVDISPGAVIGPGLRISHGNGIVIGNGADRVAWWAHVGGVLAGAMAIVVLRRRGVPLFDRPAQPG